MWIYHLVVDSDLRSSWRDAAYHPRSLSAEGFVHCADAEVVLAIADDFFADNRDPLLVLELDPARLGVPMRREAPATPEGVGRSHLEGSPLFPHVYGPIAAAAIRRVGQLERARDGAHLWPSRWQDSATAVPDTSSV